ncbi:tetratricopeptide repeat protein [Rhizobium sp. R693]|uniref:tetratricopeptide repeat protein n=1 Tax=Rhizobium sp. R693 TaxID=1764276 RepID=UPI000B5379CE|nr:tetratricopeptide repeat protein [Rhizobium sp. R693]OWV84547.1 serine/threonine protein kinase [Rhizobium sp. R693]
MKAILRISLTALMTTATIMTAEAAKIAKPTPRPVIETYANWEELRIAKRWPEVDAAVKLPLPKRLLIATAALTAPDRRLRDPNYGFALLLAGPTSRDATRLLAKGVLMNDYVFGERTPAVLRSLAAEAMRGCKSCVAAYGLIQYAGLDVPQNDAVAYKWYRWAAVVGNAKGIEATSLALAEGRGTRKNLPEAKKWAARLEPARRAKLYTEIAKRIVLSKTPEDVAASSELLLQSMALNPLDAGRPAKQLLNLDYPQSTQDEAMAAIRAQGRAADPNALKIMAQVLWKRDGPEAVNEAISIFQTLAERGNADAIDYLSKALARSDVDKSRKDLIVASLQSAAASGYVSASKVLGNAYYYGTGVTASLEAAQTYRESAAKQNDPEAQYLLGMMMLQSTDKPQDEVTGRQWLEKSAAGGYPLARAALEKLSSN